jgi:hypothetical protein
VRCGEPQQTTQTNDAPIAAMYRKRKPYSLPFPQDEETADVIFTFGESGSKELLAHRVVLATASSYFAKLFVGSSRAFDPKTQSKQAKHKVVIELEDVEPEVFGMLLSFIYTKQLGPVEPGERELDEMGIELLRATRKYAFEELENLVPAILGAGQPPSSRPAAALDRHLNDEVCC